jgi:hypothetical protein
VADEHHWAFDRAQEAGEVGRIALNPAQRIRRRVDRRDATADIWSATLHDVWLESTPAGNGGAHWMICPHVIPASQIQLVRQDIPSGRR